ncbi:ATP-dependent metallopeptidase FtsH/Yme1/Tma family protein [Lactobacillus alvi]|uniref:ATP-dependent zinc metalloprotease FtsH n=1 Tax=Limosilactobacillus alvi TaxID=990412 RepID=A0ABS2EN17_9LACO|nr:ATP-dependent zinc metalloprotease FtsH [Limosilactobacillus alvi]MBM6753815.1 ATP-dependent metallopeptidase FtsH/Yme1/Tma family protein [Limosilactobacillus alvi]
MNNNRKNNGFTHNVLFYSVIFLCIMGIAYYFFGGSTHSGQTKEVSQSEFITELKDNKVKDFTVQPNGGVYKITGTYRKAQSVSSSDKGGFSFASQASGTTKNFQSSVLQSEVTMGQLQKYADHDKVKVTTKPEESNGFWANLLTMILPLVIMIFFFYMMMGQAGQGGGGRGVMSFGKSKAKPADAKENKVRFSDVAGEEEEKQELVEVVEFLKNPKKFMKLGAKIPSGVLLEGPPGTGKTLLARAVAGEAGVPFFSISGSDFVEMFVGVGASRVRDLFEQAKKTAPAIIFIDEIDAVGRRRGNGMGGGHDEREQTLNQLLVEMDGFQGDEGVIVMAATNRADVLDPALLRPGRFDRKILVGRPDVRGREAILRVHAKNKPLASDVDLKEIAKQTPGFVGADLANLLNEAALLAARRNKTEIDAADVDEAEDRVIAGPAKRDRVISKQERRTVAYHEAGHTIVGLVLNDARVVHKVTIVPRGRAGGYAIMLPKEDQMLMSKKNAQEQIAGLMGGRAAEELIFKSQSSGASNDFEQATQIARAMVTQYGMSEKIGPVELQSSGAVFTGQEFGQSPYSERTAALIDEEVRRILNEGHEEALHIIETHREQHRIIAEALLEYETLDEKQILSLYKTGKMPEKDVEVAEEEHRAQTFEESKRELERRENARATAAEEANDEAQTADSVEQLANSAADQPKPKQTSASEEPKASATPSSETDESASSSANSDSSSDED